MADLASKRNARDLWISKGHVAAAAVLCMALVICAYALGYLAGSTQVEKDSLTGQTHQPTDEGVVELLDRIEGSTVDPKGSNTLTFPGVLADESVDERRHEQETSSMPIQPTSVAAGKVRGPIIVVNRIKRSEIALQMALKQMKAGFLVGRSLREDVYSVTIAGFDDLNTAQGHIEQLKLAYPDIEAVFEIRGQ